MRILVLVLVIVLVAGVALFLAGRHEVPEDSIGVWFTDRTHYEELGVGTFWKRPGSGRLAVFPSGPQSFLFPDSDEYRLFDADGNEVPYTYRIRYRALPDQLLYVDSFLGDARNDAGDDDLDLEGALRLRLRESMREQVARISTRIIQRTEGDAVVMAMRNVLRLPYLDLRITTESPDGASNAPDTPHVLLVGIDAGDWILMDPLLESGRLPNLASLIDSGVRANLRTLSPMLSPLIWTSIATGVRPDRHGILDFLVTDPETGAQSPVTSSLRRVPAFWNHLTQHGVSMGIVGWLATWPAETITGHMVTDRFGFLAYAESTDRDDTGMTWPPDFAAEARSLEEPSHTLPPSFWSRFVDAPETELQDLGAGGFRRGDRLANLARTVATARTNTALAEAIRARSDPRVLAVYYELVDAVGHLVMPFAPPHRESIPQTDYDRYHGTLDATYLYQDELLGRLLAGVDRSRTLVMVVSDHGMKSGSARPAGSAEIHGGEAGRWHRDPGILILAGPGVRTGQALDAASVLDITPTLLAVLGLPIPEDLDGAVLSEAFTAQGRTRYAPRFVPSVELRPEVWTAPDHAPTGGSGGPAVAALHNNLGLSLESENKLDEAAAEYRKALAAVPDDVNARNNLGGVLLKQGDTEAARTILTSLVADAPDYVPGQFNLALLDLRTEDLDEAATRLNRVLVLDPGHAAARMNLGHILLRQGDPGSAEVAFREALEAEPDLTNAWFGLGLVAAGREDYDAAREAFERVLELDPGHASAKRNLEQLAQLTGES